MSDFEREAISYKNAGGTFIASNKSVYWAMQTLLYSLYYDYSQLIRYQYSDTSWSIN